MSHFSLLVAHDECTSIDDILDPYCEHNDTEKPYILKSRSTIKEEYDDTLKNYREIFNNYEEAS